jgi:hypothetical protein
MLQNLRFRSKKNMQRSHVAGSSFFKCPSRFALLALPCTWELIAKFAGKMNLVLGHTGMFLSFSISIKRKQTIPLHPSLSLSSLSSLSSLYLNE